VFSGWVLTKLSSVIKREQLLVVVVGIMFSVLHIPALLVQQLSIFQVLLSVVLLVGLGVANSILMLRTRNLIAPVMAHALWGVTVFLFR